MLQKCDKTTPAGSLKSKSHLKNIQKQVKSSNRNWQAKN